MKSYNYCNTFLLQFQLIYLKLRIDHKEAAEAAKAKSTAKGEILLIFKSYFWLL